MPKIRAGIRSVLGKNQTPGNDLVGIGVALRQAKRPLRI
jgi:hypothetical protein